MEGEGFVQSVIDFTRQIITGRDKLAANSQKKLDKWKDYEIEGVKIVRKPIMKGINKLANYLTDGKFKKDMLKNGYDDLFHLRVDVKLKGGPCLTIEKNETVEISRGKCENLNEDGLEAMEIEVKKPRTFGEAYERMTKGYPTSKNLYDYDSVNNNCQRFVDTYLSKNSDAFNYSAEDKKFVKQDVKFVLDKYGELKKGAKILTNLAQRISLFKTGAGEEQKNKISANDIQQENMSEQEGEGFKDFVKGVKKGVKKVAKVAKKGAKVAKVASKVVEVGATLAGKEELAKKAKKAGKISKQVGKTSKQLGGMRKHYEIDKPWTDMTNEEKDAYARFEIQRLIDLRQNVPQYLLNWMERRAPVLPTEIARFRRQMENIRRIRQDNIERPIQDRQNLTRRATKLIREAEEKKGEPLNAEEIKEITDRTVRETTPPPSRILIPSTPMKGKKSYKGGAEQPQLTPQSSQPPGRAGNPVAMGKNPSAIKMTGGAMKDRIMSNRRRFNY